MKKKLLNAVCTLLIILLAVMALFVVIGKLQNKITFVFGKSVIWVMTGSMDVEGGIPARSYILIEKVNDAETEVEVGNVIVFYSEDEAIKGQLNTHRVVEVDAQNGCFVTKGDANGGEDNAKVPYANVVGKYVRNLPVLSVIGRFVMTDWGFAILMVLLLAMICAVYIPEIVKAVSQKDSAEGDAPQANEHEEEIERRIAEEVERLKQTNGDGIVPQSEVPTEETTSQSQSTDENRSVENGQTQNGENKDV